MAKNIIIDCKKCSHYKICKSPCIYVDTLANGNYEQRERPIDTDIIERGDHRDYNQVLGELIEDARQRDIERLERIRSIANYRQRMIAACILAGIPQHNIAILAHISQSRISRLYRGVR
jgi:hypothetical protein